jgi:hypothetical protein
LSPKICITKSQVVNSLALSNRIGTTRNSLSLLDRMDALSYQRDCAMWFQRGNPQ